MSVSIYIYFNGNCREAVDFYAKSFRVEKQPVMTFGDIPANPAHPIPEGANDLIMHTFLVIHGTKFMFSDVLPGLPFMAGNHVSIVINSKDTEEIEDIYRKLIKGGKATMELQETFWSKCYGSLTDKFGIDWQLSYDNGTE